MLEQELIEALTYTVKTMSASNKRWKKHLRTMKYDQTPKAAKETKSRFNDEIVAIGKDLQRIFEITAILTNQYNNEQQKLPA
jgi:predicted nucleic acid-binding protein